MIGAPQPLVLAKPAAIDIAQAARYFGARGEPDDRTMTLLETCAMPLLAAATPRAVWLEADTAALAEAGILRGGDVMKHLENCPQAVLLAVTLAPAWMHRSAVPVWAISRRALRPMHWAARWPSRPQTQRSRAAPVGRKRGKVFDRAVFARLR